MDKLNINTESEVITSSEFSPITNKKPWVTPIIILVDRDNIHSGTHNNGIESHYAPGGSTPSTLQYNYFS